MSLGIPGLAKPCNQCDIAMAYVAGAPDAVTRAVMSENTLRILYVEDNALVREITCELLSQPAREILAVSSAEEALKVFKPGAFDVVLTDVSLPAMSGLDMARRILKLAPTTAIIIATGYVLHIDLSYMGPHVRVIEKPFDASQIESLLNELCSEPGPG
jgi:CheY-like chemotaxis protein